MQTISKPEAWRLIEQTEGRIFGCTVRKRTNGEIRDFVCRLARTVKKGKVGGELGYSAKAKNLICVYVLPGDGGENGHSENASANFRMLNTEGIISLSVNGTKYQVA